MCEVSGTVTVLVGPSTRKIDSPHPGPVAVDECLTEEIADLNRRGVRTVGSCCGHGAAPAFIALAPGDAGTVLELGYERIPTPRAFGNYAGALTVSPRSGGD